MAMVEYNNDSYDRCITELRTRYRGRAVSNNMKNEMAKLSELETAEAKNTPESYILFDSRSKIADCYRSGVYNGSKYMTSDDFVRYFKSRRAFYMPSTVKAEEAKAEAVKNTAVPARKNGASSTGLTSSESGSKEGHIRGLLSFAKELAIKWFPIESRQDRAEGRRFRVPVSAMAGIAVFAISMSLIVSGSVMVGSATGEVGRLDSQIASLKAEEADLQGKLDLKYTVEQIEADAKELGMVKRQYADNESIALDNKDEIEIYDDGEEENVGLAALLSAFGIEPKD